MKNELPPLQLPCTACNSRGHIETGICESPTTACDACNGNGYTPSYSIERIKELEADARRLDYLSQCGAFSAEMVTESPYTGKIELCVNRYRYVYGFDVRAAIDAAMTTHQRK